jgi:hypothetical protein
MSGLLLAALLVSATAGEGQTWIVDPGQALVSVDAEPFSAFSHGLEGSITELDDGLNRIELHLPFATLTTGDRRQDARAARDGEAVFQGVAQGNGNRWRFVGMLRFHGVSRPAQMEVAVARTPGMIYGHAVLTVRLREFGFELPRDQARIEVDAGFRRRGVLASRR